MNDKKKPTEPKQLPRVIPLVGRDGPEQDREDCPETHVDLYTKEPIKTEED